MASNEQVVEFVPTTLGAIAATDGNGLVDGPFGSNLPASSYVAEGIPVIRGSNLTLGATRFVADEFVYVSEQTAEQLKRSLARPGDIIFTKKGTLGQTGLVPANLQFPLFLTSSNQMKLSVNREIANPLYVYYYVSSEASRSKIKRDSESTGVPKTNVGYLRDFPILLPSLAQQERIAHILGSIDDKIELNRRINQTLEAMAQAIFKSWFVDFEPVKAKAETRTAGASPEAIERAAMAAIAGRPIEEAVAQQGYFDDISLSDRESLAQTAALFPDSFQDSELGEIPENWNSSPFGDLLSYQIGGDWGKDAADEKHTEPSSIIRGTDFPDLQSGREIRVPSRWVEQKKLEKRQLLVGDIIIEVSGGSPKQPTGRSLLITDDIIRALGGTVEPASFCRLFRPVSRDIGLFAACHLTYIYSEGRMWGYQNQSTGIANFQTKRFLADEIVALPPNELLAEFMRLGSPLLTHSLHRQSRALTQLRDTLTPKLISGELKVQADA